MPTLRPITEDEWNEWLRLLPPGADRIGVRQALETAIREYISGTDCYRGLHDLWQQIERYAGSQSVQKLYEAALQLKDFPHELDPQDEMLVQHAQFLMQLRSRAEKRAAGYLPTAQRERFRVSVALAWIGPGQGTVPIAEGGPFAKFLCAIYERVVGRAYGDGIKDFAERGRDWRDMWSKVAIEIQMEIDEGGIHLLDASGRPKP